MKLETRFPAAVAALRPELERLERDGWTFAAGRSGSKWSAVEASRRDSRGSVTRYGASIRELIDGLGEAA